MRSSSVIGISTGSAGLRIGGDRYIAAVRDES